MDWGEPGFNRKIDTSGREIEVLAFDAPTNRIRLIFLLVNKRSQVIGRGCRLVFLRSLAANSYKTVINVMLVRLLCQRQLVNLTWLYKAAVGL